MSALALSAGAVVSTAVVTVATPVVAAPAQAPAPAHPGNSPLVPEGVPVDALASLAPAIIGAAVSHPADIADAGPVASPGQQSILDQAENLLKTMNLPPQIKQTLQAIIDFLTGANGGGPDIPKDGPVIAQFLYPSIGKGCIGGTSDSVGTALAVPGPADLPPPGPTAGQAGFVFTALGTKGLTPTQNPPMTVQWFNLATRQGGTTLLTDAAHINPDGPGTLSAIADTGSGPVIAVVSGSLTTQADDQSAPVTCSFLPTIGLFNVR
ncbi:Rv1157c family protein [Nocardia stercoris]|nr:hypothetical protein [Nocardia stercoris]